MMNLLKKCCLVLLLMSFFSSSFAQSLLDEDTFDNGLNGWTSSTGWDWSEDGRANSSSNFWNDRPPIGSVSGPGALAYRAAEGDIASLVGPLCQRLTAAYLDRCRDLLARELPGLALQQNKTWAELTTLGIGQARRAGGRGYR